MGKTIGVLASEQISTGLVENGAIVGELCIYPESGTAAYVLDGMPAENLTECILQQIERARQGAKIDAIGVALPGIIRGGNVEESPNLPQIKGYRLQEALSLALERSERAVPVGIFNDADAIATGIASLRGELHRFIRVWELGHGIGYGRYPWSDGIWEGGHSVVTLDPKEQFCGCGGRGHLEGIMGTRSMRLRFLDMEPEEIFANAQAGDRRCAGFVEVWHRALAAATATSIAMEGPGKFFMTGPNCRFVELHRLEIYLQEMVKMSPLQGSQLEVMPTDIETGVIGAAVNAGQFAAGAHSRVSADASQAPGAQGGIP
jgi:glucokinase